MRFLIMLFIYFGGYAYIAWRINAGLKIHSPYSVYLFIGIIALGVLSIVSFVGSRNDMPLASFLGPLGYICMGVWGITLTVFILNDVVNLFNLLFKIQNFRYWSTVAALGISVIASVWSLANVAIILDVKEINLKVPELPIKSLKVVQLSDLHITSFTTPDSIRKIFEKVQSLNPDLIVITGDVVDIDIMKDDKYLKYGFELLQAPYGVYAITGNHEYYAKLNSFLEAFEKLGIPVLRNQSIVAGEVINVAGINDTDWKNVENISKSLSAVDAKYPVLFLSHRPETFDIAAKQGYKIIQLSGHTHAGQIPPIEIARRYFMEYNYGLYNIEDSVMYVTSGTRWWGPPMRFANKGEIAVITLTKGDN